MVDAHSAMWLLAGLVWLAGSTVLAGRDGLPRGRSFTALVIGLGALWLGARLHCHLLEVGADVRSLFRSSGLRLPGGIVLALAGAPFVCGALRLPLARLLDAALPFGVAGLAVGRVGCLVARCCFGRLTDVPWAVTHPPHTWPWANHFARRLLTIDAPASLPVHPLTLYMIVTWSVVAVFLLRLRRRPRVPGEIGLAGLALVGGLGALLEHFRDTSIEHVPLRFAIPLALAVGAGAAWWLLTSLNARERNGRTLRSGSAVRGGPRAAHAPSRAVRWPSGSGW